MWHYDGDNFVLRAREKVEAGAEITVSYLSEEALLESTVSRRAHLEATKHFTCCCERCSLSLDGVRGFTCPSCHNGQVFLDISEDMEPAPASQGACEKCGFFPMISQVQEMVAQERKLEQMVQDWDRKAGQVRPDVYLSDTAALRLESNIAGLLSSRHWLRDRVNHHLISYYEATGRADLALPLARQCVEYIVNSYPGSSALHAWALETVADLMLKLEGFRLTGPAAVEAPQAAPNVQLKRVWSDVGPIYSEAAQILGALFGQEHDFHITMRAKRESLQRATRN
eukprot:TRINITY_DN30186_c0_g3_i4.p1 TRINITY_DN30186_c0_g3~~TRINITY_DN30186_c0_g3_i4.p1  ORF type:complete len:284 (+),score=44.68 TRINITY_DN30186_c0_g3_i4:134-985(+)